MLLTFCTRSDNVRVISTVLNWDVKELESRVSKIEKDKQCPSKDILTALNNYMKAGVEKQDELRQHSQTSSNSIVLTILADANTASDMKEETHKLALDYLACKLSIRDRLEIIRVACHSHPDYTTMLVRTVFDAYQPVIRQFHNAVDLADTVNDFQIFVTDMLKVGRIQPPGKDGKTTVPTVGDFITLLRKHQYMSHKFIHQLCKNGKEVTRWYVDWAKEAALQFQRDSSFVDASESQDVDAEHSASQRESLRDAGDLTKPLQDLFKALPATTRKQVTTVLDEMVLYIDEMHASSRQRLSDVLRSTPAVAPTASLSKMLSSKIGSSRPNSRPNSRSSSPARSSAPGSREAQAQTQNAPTSASHEDPAQVPHVSSDPGPGAFLARWQDLMDSTPITPLTAHGRPHRASDKAIVEKSATDVDGGKMVEFETKQKTLDSAKVMPSVSRNSAQGKKNVSKKPDVKVVIEAFSDDFRKLLAERNLNW